MEKAVEPPNQMEMNQCLIGSKSDFKRIENKRELRCPYSHLGRNETPTTNSENAGVADHLSYAEKLEIYNTIKASQNDREDKKLSNKKIKSYQIISSDSDEFETGDIDTYSRKKKENSPEWLPGSAKKPKKALKRKANNLSPDTTDVSKSKINKVERNRKKTNKSAVTTQTNSLLETKQRLSFNQPNIFTQDLTNIPIDERIELFVNYHNEIAKKYKEAQLKSKKYVKWGNPITPTGKLDKVRGCFDFSDTDDETDDYLLINQYKNEKQRKDSILKSPENFPNKSFVADTENNPEFEDETETNSNTSKLNNSCAELFEEFIVPGERFSVSPKIDKNRSFCGGALSRSDILFENLRAHETKQKQKEREMEKFEQTLNAISDEEEMSEQDKEEDEVTLINEGQEEFRKRITPPNRFKYKAGSSKKTGVKPGNETKTRRRKLYSPDNLVEEKQKPSTHPLVECPMCFEKYPKNIIADHAENCIDINTQEEIKKLKAVNCNICNKKFLLDENYQKHVSNCIAKQSFI